MSLLLFSLSFVWCGNSLCVIKPSREWFNFELESSFKLSSSLLQYVNIIRDIMTEWDRPMWAVVVIMFHLRSIFHPFSGFPPLLFHHKLSLRKLSASSCQHELSANELTFRVAWKRERKRKFSQWKSLLFLRSWDIQTFIRAFFPPSTNNYSLCRDGAEGSVLLLGRFRKMESQSFKRERESEWVGKGNMMMMTIMWKFLIQKLFSPSVYGTHEAKKDASCKMCFAMFVEPFGYLNIFHAMGNFVVSSFLSLPFDKKTFFLTFLSLSRFLFNNNSGNFCRFPLQEA